jgi:hypothetical protein
MPELVRSEQELIDLKELWEKCLGAAPSDTQFDLWLSMHTKDVVRIGILKTAEKNLTLHGSMSVDHKLRFASSVMNARTDGSRPPWSTAAHGVPAIACSLRRRPTATDGQKVCSAFDLRRDHIRCVFTLS